MLCTCIYYNMCSRRAHSKYGFWCTLRLLHPLLPLTAVTVIQYFIRFSFGRYSRYYIICVYINIATWDLWSVHSIREHWRSLFRALNVRKTFYFCHNFIGFIALYCIFLFSFADITSKNRLTHNRCRGRRRNRLPRVAVGTVLSSVTAVAQWGWGETRYFCPHRRRRHCPPTHRRNAPTCPACPPARPNCVCSTRNTWRPSGKAFRRDWPNAGRSSCTAGGTVRWPPRTSVRHSSVPICKQVRILQ